MVLKFELGVLLASISPALLLFHQLQLTSIQDKEGEMRRGASSVSTLSKHRAEMRWL